MRKREFFTGMMAVVAVLALVGGVMLVRGEPAGSQPAATEPAAAPKPVPNIYFYDLGVNKIFASGSGQIPPIPAPSGDRAEAVRAYIFACGDCRDVTNWHIGYLEKYSPEAKALLTTAAGGLVDITEKAADAIRQGHLISGPEGKPWFQAESKDAKKIFDKMANQCGKEKLVICEPAPPATQPSP